MAKHRVAALLAVACLAAPFSPAFGQERTARPLAGPVAGTVVDPAGQPVAGAQVWLVGGTWDESPSTLAETKTDLKGRFLFADVRSARDQGTGRQPGVIPATARGGSAPAPISGHAATSRLSRRCRSNSTT